MALAALTALEAKATSDPSGLDKAALAMMGMQVKKGNKALPKPLWTPECQGAFTKVIGLL